MSGYLKAFLIASLALVCLSLVPVSAQGEKGRMIRRLALPSDPVDKITPEVGGKPIRFNGFFNAGHDWLKGLKVKLRNRSGKNIIFAGALLIIPKSGTMQEPFGIQIRYGQPPALDSIPDKPVRHGQVFELSLSDNAYDTTMNYLAENQVSEVFGVEMSNLMIVYDDDTAWEDGIMFRRDRTRPYAWKSAGDAKPVEDNEPADEVKPPRKEFQNISFTRPIRYYASRLAAEDQLVSCYSYFNNEYVLCGTQTGDLACIAPNDSSRSRDPDEFEVTNRKALVSITVNCQGVDCSSVKKSAQQAQYDWRCSYSGGNEWQ